jgi:purine-nucleoside phosphorylase
VFGTSSSVLCLSDETPALLEAWHNVGIDLIDLEVSTVAAWCNSHKVKCLPFLVVSDHPRTDQPLWCKESLGDTVDSSLQQSVTDALAWLMPPQSEPYTTGESDA